MADKYFPDRAERQVLDFVGDCFPFPLALTYVRLHEEMDRQEPVAAAWQLRDSFECLLKFTASLAVADFLQTNPEGKEAEEIISLLFKPQGLSMGDWYTLLETALKPLAPLARQNLLGDSGRCLPNLYSIFFDLKGKKTELNRKFNSSNEKDESFIPWRNRVFGHGVFKKERSWYADETTRRLDTLHKFYQALRSVLDGWILFSSTPSGEEIIWQGASELPRIALHQHQPLGPPTSMALRFDPQNIPVISCQTPPDGTLGQYNAIVTPASKLPESERALVRSRNKEAIAARRLLHLGPFLSVQQCSFCQQPTAFFYDRNKHNPKQNSHRTFFLEYFRGHERDNTNWAEMQELAKKLPSKFEWKRESYDRDEVGEGVRTVLRDFEQEYIRPSKLMDSVWEIVENQLSGYIHLTAPGGTGKTYFVRGLGREGESRGVPVLTYHILSGKLTDYRTFISELSDRAREAFRFRTQEAQTAVDSVAGLQNQFTDFLRELMEANHLDTLVVAVDALDELPALTEEDGATITSFLPPPDNLPEGCFIVLTSRKALHPRIQEDLVRLSKSSTESQKQSESDVGPSRFNAIDILPSDEDNLENIRTYLRARLPKPLRTDENIRTLLERSKGIFLYAFHFYRAIEAGAFTDPSTMPTSDRFYLAYLDRIRKQVGTTLFETGYLPVLIYLAAAVPPVPLSQLHRWGLPKERLNSALVDLRDFLHVTRNKDWNDSLVDESYPELQYEIAHEAIREFLQNDPQLSLLLDKAHGVIARSSLSLHSGKWDQLDPTNDADLYDLRFTLWHLEDAGMTGEAESLRHDEGYLAAVLMSGKVANLRARYQLAFELFFGVLETLQTKTGEHTDPVFKADLYASLADAMHGLKMWKNAVQMYDAAIDSISGLDQTNRDSLTKIEIRSLMGKAESLSDEGRLLESMKCYNKVIQTIKAFQDQHSCFNHELANALMGKGALLLRLQEFSDALNCFSEANDAYKGISPEEAHHLPSTFMPRLLTFRGKALLTLERPSEALVCFENAIGIIRPIIAAGQTEYEDLLAEALYNKGIIELVDAEDPNHAELYFSEAIKIFTKLVSAGRTELTKSLINALSKIGHFYTHLQDWPRALACTDKLIQITKQFEEQGNSKWSKDLAEALAQKGLIYSMRGDYISGIGFFNDAISRIKDLIDEGQTDLTFDLAEILKNKVLALLRMKKFKEALVNNDEQLEVLKGLVKEGQRDPISQLELALNLKISLLIRLGEGDSDNYRRCLDETIDIYKRLVDGDMLKCLSHWLKP